MVDSLSPVDNYRPLGDIIFQKLQDAIIDGRLQPGQWLRQDSLAQELGVSQMPVRDALKRLVAEGLAVRIPYKGVRVVEFSPQDIVDMCTVRLVLEGLVVRFATPLISGDDLERLQQNLDQAKRCTKQAQLARRRRLNTEFHLIICRASGHQYLVNQVESLWRWFPAVMLYEGMRRQKALSPARLERESQEHAAILAALQARDAGRAEEITRRHIRHLSEELAAVLGISPEALEPLLTLCS